MRGLLNILPILIVLISASAFAIRGGTAAGKLWPEAVAISWGQYTGTQEPVRCSAVFQGSNLIITAAHCIWGLHAGDELRIDKHTQSALGGQAFRIKKVKTHPGYEPNADRENYNWDVGFIELEDPKAAQTFGVQTFAPFSKEKLITRTKLTVVGLGPSFAIQRQNQDRPTEKRWAELQSSGRSQDLLTLTSSGPASPCAGDSGGPVFRGPVLIGVMVLVNGNCMSEQKYTAVHDISYSLSWLEQELGYSL